MKLDAFATPMVAIIAATIVVSAGVLSNPATRSDLQVRRRGDVDLHERAAWITFTAAAGGVAVAWLALVGVLVTSICLKDDVTGGQCVGAVVAGLVVGALGAYALSGRRRGAHSIEGQDLHLHIDWPAGMTIDEASKAADQPSDEWSLIYTTSLGTNGGRDHYYKVEDGLSMLKSIPRGGDHTLIWRVDGQYGTEVEGHLQWDEMNGTREYYENKEYAWWRQVTEQAANTIPTVNSGTSEVIACMVPLDTQGNAVYRSMVSIGEYPGGYPWQPGQSAATWTQCQNNASGQGFNLKGDCC